jgi:N-acetylglucosaminyldiphosphoundecaprenol N-acetyl-beta-D-mannosaminyltransferase
MPAVLQSIEAAAKHRIPFVISTPNLNFLVNSQSDAEFRETLLMSDLCPADGMPIIWIAMLIGIPIRTRIAGSDIFEALKAYPRSAPLKVVLFGASEGAAAAASKRLNSDSASLKCVGWVYPGFANVDELSQDQFIEKINASNADFLVAGLGAKKGQLWLRRNHDRLCIPIRSHLGAVINFQAGTIRRAPQAMQKCGLEWLWRIKEEPLLWKRYWNDGKVLLRLLLTHVLPLMVWTRWLDLKYRRRTQDLSVTKIVDDTSVAVHLSGCATARHLDKLILVLEEAISLNKKLTIDFSGILTIDARFLGLLLMLRKKLNGTGANPIFVGISSELQRTLHLHGAEFLISSDGGVGSRSSCAGKYVDVPETTDYIAAA